MSKTTEADTELQGRLVEVELQLLVRKTDGQLLKLTAALEVDGEERA